MSEPVGARESGQGRAGRVRASKAEGGRELWLLKERGGKKNRSCGGTVGWEEGYGGEHPSATVILILDIRW